MRRNPDSRGFDAGRNQLLTHELHAFLREAEVVIRIATLIGETVELNANIGHRRNTAGKFREPRAGRVREHVLIGSEQQIRGDPRLHQVHESRTVDGPDLLELRAQRIEVVIENADFSLQRNDIEAGAVECRVEIVDLDILSVKLVADLGADRDLAAPMTSPTGPPATAPISAPDPTPMFSVLDAGSAKAGDAAHRAINESVVIVLRIVLSSTGSC